MLAVIDPVFPPKAKADVCVPQPAKYFLAVFKGPLLCQAAVATKALRLKSVEL